jgi:hypothetical protein
MKTLPRGPFALLTTACAVGLAGWIVTLCWTLPAEHTAHGWRTAWVGFDCAELIAFAVTAWSAWRRRQVTMPASLVSAVLLLCDAWFDVSLSWGTSEQWASVATALFGELPLAFLLWRSSYRLARLTVASVRAQLGTDAATTRIRDVELVSLRASA